MWSERILISLVFCGIGAGQPIISAAGAANSASYLPACTSNGGVGQGSVFVLFGSGLGPATLQQISRYPLESALAGTSIKVAVGGTTVDALPLYTSSGQIAALLPGRTPLGDGTVTVTYAGKTSAPSAIRVVRNGFGV